jgi:hypothetical protein
MNQPPEVKDVKCAYCGNVGPHRYHSGVPECQPCWDWRKLDSPTARYWFILSRMVGSSVDTYDLTQFFPKRLDLDAEDIKAFNRIIIKMADKTGEMAKAHHVDEHWEKQAQALFDQLGYGIWPDPRKENDK